MPVASDLSGATVTVALDDPLFIVVLTRGLQGCIELLGILAVMNPQQLPLERSHEPLGDTIARQCADKARARFEPQGCDHGLEVIADVSGP